MVVDVVTDRRDQLFEILEYATAQLFFRQVAEESFHHVEPGSRSRREVDMEALVSGQPAIYPFMLVGRVVVADRVDVLALGNSLVDQAPELEPLLMAVALLTQAKEFAVERVERSKQCRRAVALVVVRHGLAAPLLQGQPWLSSIQRLNLTLLACAQNQRVFRRIQIQANDGFQLVGKLRVAANLERLDQVRLEPMGVQIRRTLASLMPTSRAIVRVDQCVALA